MKLCRSFTPVNLMHGQCSKGLFGGRPSLGTCRLICTQQDIPADFDSMTQALSERTKPTVEAKPCGCGKRVDELDKTSLK